MGKLFKKFEDLMSAAAFAEAGEHATAREMSEAGALKRVMLVINSGQTDMKAARYAVGAATRVGAALEVLVVDTGLGHVAKLEPIAELASASKVDMYVGVSEGCVRDAVLEHSAGRSDLTFIVAGSDSVMGKGCATMQAKPGGGRLEAFIKKLGCPLVLVSELETT